MVAVGVVLYLLDLRSRKKHPGQAADPGGGQPAEAEIEQFRDVLYTLKPADLLGWEQSVTKRGIVLPTSIRDEFIALYNDAKTSN